MHTTHSHMNPQPVTQGKAMFLHEDHLTKAILHLLTTEPTLRIATAFIGTGASRFIGSQCTDAKIVCNLSMGSTNPQEIVTLIQRFGKSNVRQVNNLHAKLYIGSEYAIVGSANMSHNGLGFQPTALREAGYRFPLEPSNRHSSLDWFDQLWAEAREITEKDLKNAEEKWKRRDKNRDGEWNFDSRNICHYDFDRDDFPLLDWFGSSTREIIDNTPIHPALLSGWSSLQEAVDGGVGIECEKDSHHIQKDRWVLRFHLRKNATPEWDQLSGIVLPCICRHTGETEAKSVALVKKDTNGAGPFDMDKAITVAFQQLLFRSEKYQELCNNEFKGCWFEPRLELMRQFWKELQLTARRLSKFTIKE